MKARDYDSTVARIAGNILSGIPLLAVCTESEREEEQILVERAVARARAIVAEVKRTEPDQEGR